MQKCRICGSQAVLSSERFTSPINGLDYTLFKCKDCRSLFYNPDENSLDLQKLYDSFTSRDNFPIEFTPNKKWQKEKKIVEKLLLKEITSILDVGCRTGDFLMHFPESVNRVGVEIADEFSIIAQKRGLKVYNENLEHIQMPEKFDVVTCYAILEHLVSPVIFLDSLSLLVKKGGILVIMIPTFQSVKPKFRKGFGKAWHMNTPPEHLNFFSRFYLDNYLKENGFTKISRRYTSGGLFHIKAGIIRKAIAFVSNMMDQSFISRLPIFDHMYTYYRKVQ